MLDLQWRKAPVRESQDMPGSIPFSIRHPLRKRKFVLVVLASASWLPGLLLPSVKFPSVGTKEEFEEKVLGSGKVRHSPLVDSSHH